MGNPVNQDKPSQLVVPPDQSETRFNSRLQMVALGLLVLVLCIYLLREFATVLQQLCIAAFIAYLIMPVHSWFVRRRVPPGACILAYRATDSWAAFGLGEMIYYNVAHFNSNISAHQAKFNNLVQNAIDQLPPRAAEQARLFLDQEAPLLQDHVRVLQSILGTFFDFLSQLVLVLIYLVFILAERLSLTRRLRSAISPEDTSHIMAVVDRINWSIANYVAVKTYMSFLAGMLTSLVLWGFGVDYAVFWGVVAFLLNFIPYLGSWVAVILPVALSLIQLENPWLSPLILAILLLVQNAIGYVVEPRIAGSRLNLSPFVIILSLAFWGTLWGVVGMILAVPLVVVVKSILENIPQTKPMATLLSNG